MNLTKTDIKFIVVFLLFVGVGLWGSFYFGIREDKTALKLSVQWFIVPSLIIGSIYGYYGGYKRSPEQALWRKLLAVLALTLVSTLIFLRSFQGYIWIANCQIGKQQDVFISGVIIKIDKPERKKLLNSYTIYVEDSNRTVALDVPGEVWAKGQFFQRRLRRGSLGLIYGD
jgi:hypothetical protein